MVVLKSIDVGAYAKIQAMINAIMGIIFGLIIDGVLAYYATTITAIVSYVVLLAPNLAGYASLFTPGVTAYIAWPLILFVIFAIMGVIVGAITALIYNFCSGKVGGIELTFSGSPSVLKSVGIASYAKILALGYMITLAIIGLIFGILTFNIISMLIFLVIGAILGAIFGLIGGVIEAFMYNIIAGAVGGIQLAFDKGMSTINRVPIWPYARFNLVFEAVIGFIVGVISLLSPTGTPYVLSSLLSLGSPILGLLVQIVLYAVLGLIGGVLFCLIYNFSAKRVGGIVLKLQ